MSFSSLPPELVHQIIGSTVPHTFHSTTYKERQRTLYSLSLVSKLFRSTAQPLLFEIVKLGTFEDMEKLPTARTTAGDAHSRDRVRWLVIKEDGWPNRAQTEEEEEEKIFVGLRGFGSVTSLTINLTSLHLTDCRWEEPIRNDLANLRDLTLNGVSSELFTALVDPATVPNLRNFAFLSGGEVYMEDLTRSKLDQLLPQLETLNFAAGIWLDPRAAFLRSAASRTLVDFDSYDAKRLNPSTNSLQHIRIRYSSPHSLLFSHDNLRWHLDR
ncbi:hypothetical protein JCM3765_003499 [Sporobolomyces pararoseus]